MEPSIQNRWHCFGALWSQLHNCLFIDPSAKIWCFRFLFIDGVTHRQEGSHSFQERSFCWPFSSSLFDDFHVCLHTVSLASWWFFVKQERARYWKTINESTSQIPEYVCVDRLIRAIGLLPKLEILVFTLRCKKPNYIRERRKRRFYPSILLMQQPNDALLDYAIISISILVYSICLC